MKKTPKTVAQDPTPQETETTGSEVAVKKIGDAPIPPTFTKVDNNLTGIGFFAASSTRSRKAVEKTAIITDGDIEYRITILPSAKYGLPITQDQDYWLALMKLVSEHRKSTGKDVTNPFRFSTAELLHILGQVDSGNNYKAVNEWLSVIGSTSIEGGAYNTVQKTWVIKRTHALESTVTTGKKLPNGKIAEKNYIWFSQWQLDNINSGKLIPIELTTYKQLNTNIARNLVPHLQEWLYTSQRDGRFEKRYEDVCQLLGISVYTYRSKIEEKLGPSLDELVTHSYISKWAIEPTADDKGFKVVLWHGPKFFADRQARLEGKHRRSAGKSGQTASRRPRQQVLKPAKPTEPTPQPPVVIDPNLVAEFVKRGISADDARKHIAAAGRPGLEILDQLEYGDIVVSAPRSNIKNIPGFYVSLVQKNVSLPPGFISSRKAKEILEEHQRREEAFRAEREARERAEEAERQRIELYIAALPEYDRRALFDEVLAELFQRFPHLREMKNAVALHEEPIRAGMRLKVSEGWTPKSI